METKIEQIGQVANVDQSGPIHVDLNRHLASQIDQNFE